MPISYLPGQADLPQTAPTDSQWLASQSAKLIKANKPQLACDVGLFSDDRNQLDLLERATKTK